MTQTESSHHILAAIVAEHRDQLKAYADSEKETAWLTEALLEYARANRDLVEVQSE